MIDQTADDAAAFGIELDLEPDDDDYQVEPEAWPALQMFLRCQTQWRTGPNGLIGLDYGPLEWAFRLYGAEDPAAMLDDIQIIEAEVLMAVHEQAT